MEYGIKITNEKELEGLDKKYSHIYFGNEFCERKIPSIEELLNLLNKCKKEGRKLVLLTPPLTDKGLITLKNLIQTAYKENQDFEVTINDFGIIEELRKLPKLKITCGRTLIRMKKGPEIMSGCLNEPPENFKDNSLSNREFRELLKENGIQRFEVDIPPQGINLPKKENLTLYLGNSSISVTRRCIYPKCDKKDYDYQIGECKKECLFQIVSRENPYFKQPVFVVGNAEIIKTENKIPSDLKGKINRIVIFPSLKSNL
jgi:hypothetical protein